MSEWILRLMPLAVRHPAPALDSDANALELARFRLRIIPPHERPGSKIVGPTWCTFDVGPVRVLGLDSANPHGGVGGSFDSEQCAWLVRELEQCRNRYVIIASHDGSRTMTNATAPAGQPARVLGSEVVSILLAHPTVLAWVSGTMHERSGRRHGDVGHGFWEIPGAASGLGAPLSGGLSIVAEPRHLHRMVVLRGALAGEHAPGWEVRDPLPALSESTRPTPAGLPT